MVSFYPSTRPSMPNLSFNPERLLTSALSATGVHLDPRNILDGLDWQRAGATPNGVPHSIFQLVNHVIYWQDLFLSGLDRKDVAGPKRAQDGWPGALPVEAIAFYAFTSGTITALYTPTKTISFIGPALSVSPEERLILFGQIERSEDEIMLLDL